MAGAVAGLGGFGYYSILSSFDVSTFPIQTALTVAVIAVVGGLRTPVGASLGVLPVLALPTFVALTPLEFLGLAAAVLTVVLMTPNGRARPLLAAPHGHEPRERARIAGEVESDTL